MNGAETGSKGAPGFVGRSAVQICEWLGASDACRQVTAEAQRNGGTGGALMPVNAKAFGLVWGGALSSAESNAA